MSDTPRTDQAEYECVDEPVVKLGSVDAEFARQLERELNAEKQRVTELEGRLRALWDKLEKERKHYQERIKRLEEAGDKMADLLDGGVFMELAVQWHEAKEAKP